LSIDFPKEPHGNGGCHHRGKIGNWEIFEYCREKESVYGISAEQDFSRYMAIT
jgi:hypothetical protein